MKEKNKRLRIGVCGIGSIGFRHARLLSQRGGTEIFVADPVESHREAAMEMPGVAASVDSFDRLLEFGLDGLIIATPDQFHISQAEEACRKGVAVLIEKPIAENVTQCESLITTIKETNAKVLVGYPLRHNAVFQKAKEMVDRGLIGGPVSFQITLGAYNTLVAAKNRFSPSDKNKLFVDYSHEWDYLHWFLGKVKRVIGISHTSGNRERKQAPNVVNALFDMESGVSGTAHLDYILSPGTRTFTIVGDEGVITINATRMSISLQKYDDDFERIYTISETFDGMMLRQIEHFLDVIKADVECMVTVVDGINALRVADALIMSIERNSWCEVYY